ncbi:acyltransferase [Mesorhizobium sp. ES1-1]|uniref:acyltransferase family protein n=1 Tax=Mesorhizobium sp. ES1-1 TaxID=2876629 RepID=UPI0029625696|nr:acyltransferase [Mesorhizobium sp. ES1-1]
MMRGQVQLQALQQGRGLAAMAVAAFHLSITLSLPRYLGQDVFVDFTRRGNLGVDFFFVLSGFIIAFAHSRDVGRPDRLGNYLVRRFIRLFPVYWVCLAVFCALVAMGVGTAVTLPDTVGHWISTVFLIRLDGFIFPIAPAWTLVHELAFYVVFALLIVEKRVGIAVFGLWMLACLLMHQYPDYDNFSAWTTYFSPLNLNFLVGMLAFYAWMHGKPIVVKLAFPIGLTLLATVYGLESRGISYNLLQIPYAVAFGMIITGAAALESAGQWPSNARLLNLIGDASYSIYLTHLAFLGLLAKIMIKLAGYVPLPPELVYAVVFAGTIACGCLLHLFVERPLIAACRKCLGGRPKPSFMTSKAG